MDTCGTQNPSPVHILTLGKLNPYLYSAMAVPTMFHTFALPCHLRLPKTFSCASPMATTATASPLAIGSDCGVSIKGLLYPALSYTNTLYFKSAYNVQIVVGDDEPEDRIVYRFKKEVLKAGVLQECRRRRFFENKHDKIKRKARQASRRNRKRKPRSRALAENKHDSEKKKDADGDDDTGIDNWELPEALYREGDFK
ncbi:30S ribosomal protein S21, chloroplastic [Vigna radiata var. radiata]|uniref:30S ribosomal protein S21, chloroplastic n=1 Tax=Vigna radiata var. radiata TaxID=3916 RepID=A0A3Q0F9G2_VIGRR|nr:30S ribosomal protein S21, chloroplastic [Vigna radiata var. radiata]